MVVGWWWRDGCAVRSGCGVVESNQGCEGRSCMHLITTGVDQQGNRFAAAQNGPTEIDIPHTHQASGCHQPASPQAPVLDRSLTAGAPTAVVHLCVGG